MLESTDYDFPLNLREEHHMLLDKPGIMMRRQLTRLLKQHGEIEQRLNSFPGSTGRNACALKHV